MLESIFKFFWDFLKRIAGYLADIVLWLVEFLYSLVNGILDFLLVTFADLVVDALEAVKPHVPDDLVSSIVAMYEWLEYIDEWIPISFGIKLLIAYFAIMFVLIVIRWILRLIPGMGG